MFNFRKSKKSLGAADAAREQARRKDGRFGEQAHDRADDVDLGVSAPGFDGDFAAVESARRVDDAIAQLHASGRVELDGDASAVEVAVIAAVVDRMYSPSPRPSPLDGVVFPAREEAA